MTTSTSFPDVQRDEHPPGYAEAPQIPNTLNRTSPSYFAVAHNAMGSIENTGSFGAWGKIIDSAEMLTRIAELDKYFAGSSTTGSTVSNILIRGQAQIIKEFVNSNPATPSVNAGRLWFGASVITPSPKTPLPDVVRLQTPHPEVRRFAVGVNDIKPADSLVRMANRIVLQALKHLTDPDIAFDDEDGSLNFDLKLNNGHTMFVELYPDGNSYVGVYDETDEGDAKTILFLSDATEKQIIELFSEE